MIQYLGLKPYLTERVAKTIFKNIISGLEHIYEKNISHRDVKPDNILVSNSYEIKIGDFGHSTFFTPGVPLQKGNHGTKLYRAP